MKIELKDFLPKEFFQEFMDTRVVKMLNIKVIQEFNAYKETTWKRWPGKHKYTFCWWLLENNYAVGWNENPAKGWSFPLIKLKTK